MERSKKGANIRYLKPICELRTQSEKNVLHLLLREMNVIFLITLAYKFTWEKEAEHTFLLQGEGALPSISSSSIDNFILIFLGGSLSQSWSMSYQVGLSLSPAPAAKHMTLARPMRSSQIGTEWTHDFSKPIRGITRWFCENHQEKPFLVVKNLKWTVATAVVFQPWRESLPGNGG